MGQTPSKDKDQQFADLYSSYIQQQQDLIFQQQQQINDLYKFNLQAQQQMPANMFFQSDMQQPSLGQGQQQGMPNAVQPPPPPQGANEVMNAPNNRVMQRSRNQYRPPQGEM